MAIKAYEFETLEELAEEIKDVACVLDVGDTFWIELLPPGIGPAGLIRVIVLDPERPCWVALRWEKDGGEVRDGWAMGSADYLAKAVALYQTLAED